MDFKLDTTLLETFEELDKLTEAPTATVEGQINPRILNLKGKSRGKYLLKLDTILKGIDHSDAYYNSEWIKYWLDGMDAEEAGVEFADDDDYYKMLNIFKDLFSRYYKYGFDFGWQSEGTDWLEDNKYISIVKSVENDFGFTGFSDAMGKYSNTTKQRQAFLTAEPAPSPSAKKRAVKVEPEVNPVSRAVENDCSAYDYIGEGLKKTIPELERLRIPTDRKTLHSIMDMIVDLWLDNEEFGNNDPDGTLKSLRK